MRRFLLLTLALGAMALSACTVDGSTDDGMPPELGAENWQNSYEKYMYVTAINQHGDTTGPDILAMVGTDPRDRDTYGQVFATVELGDDEVHHFNYSLDQNRLLVPGLMSGRIYVLDVNGDDQGQQGWDNGRPPTPAITSTYQTLVPDSQGYIAPHTLIPIPGNMEIATMLGSASPTTEPGGVVLLDDHTGHFISHFGPPPQRTDSDLGPNYMYDFDADLNANRAITSTFGPIAQCAAGALVPTCYGNTISVWDYANQQVIQNIDLGEHSGAMEVRILRDGTRRGYTNTMDGHLWFFQDDDHDGFYDAQAVLGPEDGLVYPSDILVSYDQKTLFMTDYFANNVRMYDIRDRTHPRLLDEVPVPHADMLRLSKDGHRLYVANSLITPADLDPSNGGPRNNDYGIYLFYVDTWHGHLYSATRDGSAWADFSNLTTASDSGTWGPHMMLFDPSIKMGAFEH